MARIAAPTVASAPTIGGVAQVGQTLTLAGGTFGNGPTALTYSFYRLARGALTLVQTAGASRSYVVGRADHGSTIVGRVTGTNGAGSALVDSPGSAVVLPGLPSRGAPVIDGLPAIVDRQLAVAPGSWDNGGAPGQPTVAAVRWYSCATACALVGHTATYVPGAADAGRRLWAEIDVVNAAGTATAPTVTTGVVTAGPPTLVSAPVVSGPARVGETLSALAAVATGHGAARDRHPGVVRLPRRRRRLLHRRRRSGRHPPDRRERSAACACGYAPTCAAPAARSPPGRRRPSRCWAATSACWWRRGRSRPVSAPPRAITLEASLDRNRAAAGQAVVVRGRVTIAGDVARPDRVTVVHGGRAQLAAVDAAGGFALTFVPVLSERVTVSVTVAGRGEALALDAGEVRVVPRMTARFTVRRDRFGTGRDLRVTGRVMPRVPVSKFRLLLEGRTPKGRVVGLICRVDEQPVVLDGLLRRPLHVARPAAPRDLPRAVPARPRLAARGGADRLAASRAPQVAPAARRTGPRTATLLAAPRSL